jgi:hypothetical protein
MTTKVLKTTPRLIKPIESQDEPREDAKLNHLCPSASLSTFFLSPTLLTLCTCLLPDLLYFPRHITLTLHFLSFCREQQHWEIAGATLCAHAFNRAHQN